MTKKDYQALASAIHESRFELCGGGPDCEDHEDTRLQWERTRSLIADALQEDNPRFSRSTFLAACDDGNVARRPKR